MATSLRRAALLLLYTSLASAQFGGFSGGNPFSGGNDPNSNNPSNGGGDFDRFPSFVTHMRALITPHAVLATLAFGLLFPLGGTLIRVCSFRGVWLAHAGLQAVALVLYIAAFAIGIYLATNLRLMSDPHAIIGIVLFVLLLLQPVSGLLHHFMFVKRQSRGVWSYAHLWLGRFVITLGIINGGLGLQLANRTPLAAPPTAAIVIYGALAGTMWLVYVAAAVYGELKRKSALKAKREQLDPATQQKEGERTEYA